MKHMGLDNLITIFFNQPYVLTTSIEKETNPKKSQLICFGFEKNGKNLVLRKKVNTTNRNGEVTTHISMETYFIYIFFIFWLVSQNQFLFIFIL